MAQIIEIENGVTRIVDRTVQYEVPTSDLDQFLAIPKPAITPTLPAGDNLRTVRSYVDEANGTIRLLVERAPRTEHITIALNGSHGDAEGWADQLNVPRSWLDGSHVFPLPLPWEYYDFEFSTGRRLTTGPLIFQTTRTTMYWRKTQFKEFDDQFYHARLPNVSGGSMCWGDINDGVQDSVADRAKAMIVNWYAQPFNEDWGHMDFPANLGYIEDLEVDPITQIPAYEWSEWYPERLHWDQIGPATLDQTAVEGMPPGTWNMVELRAWYEGLSPMRRLYVDQLRDIIPAPAEEAVPA